MKWQVFTSISAWLLLASPGVSAYEVQVAGAATPEALACPSGKRLPPSQPQPTSEVVADVPDETEVNAALAGAVTAASASDDFPPLFQNPRHLRIVLWGDSHAAANIFSDALVQALGLRDKRVLPGFIPPTMGNANVRLPLRHTCMGEGWRTEHAYRNRDAGATWSRALTRIDSDRQGTYLWLDFRSPLLTDTFRTLDIQLSRGPGEPRVFERGEAINPGETGVAPTVLRFSVNDDPDQVLELDPARDNLLRIVAEHPIATLKLTLVAGSVGIDGFIPHYDVEPDYIFDTMGIPGATARGLQFLGGEQGADYDLVMVEFGTNEGNNPGFDAGSYAHDLRKSLARLRRFYPDAACVLIGPTDRGVLVPRPKTKKAKQCMGKGKRRKCKASAPPRVDLLRYSRTHATIGNVQAEVGKDFQCHAWSWQSAMGGPGGIYRWLRQKPALAQRDLTHLTGSGYRLSAQLFAQKLLGTTRLDAPTTGIPPAELIPALPAKLP
jgi:hypothetical protein